MCRIRDCCIHIGVGFEVAYLYVVGKFEGLKSEISNCTDLTLFLYICLSEWYYFLIGDHKVCPRHSLVKM